MFMNSPTPVWYGEGDDMFFIDGAEKATLHGHASLASRMAKEHGRGHQSMGK